MNYNLFFNTEIRNTPDLTSPGHGKNNIISKNLMLGSYNKILLTFDEHAL